MNEPIKYISKVEIKNLWGRYDIEWNLDPSVNILSGINGSGKSTVLDCIGSIIHAGTLIQELINRKVSQVVITFNNDEKIVFRRVKDLIKNLEHTAKNDRGIYELISDLKEKEGKNYKNLASIDFGVTSFGNSSFNLEKLHEQVNLDVISTFDKTLNQNDSPHEEVKTELDRDIFNLQKQYLDYQLNTGKKAFEIISKNSENSHEKILELKKQHNRFLEIVDLLFADTNKKVDREINELMFLRGKEKLTPYQLSSGEKQMLVILMTVLVQDNKSSLLFMDEPEISLHIDWQRKLIQYIKELNHNVQIILATHSPGIILEGWADKVSEMSGLITLDRQAKLENAK